MTRQPNLKVLAFVGSESEDVVTYLTGKGFPKVSEINMMSQIEHLSMAGQHRIVTSEITDGTSYTTLKQEFPGEVRLVTVGSVTDQELVLRADYSVQNTPDKIEALLEEIDFKL
jgi:hypothetical protein